MSSKFICRKCQKPFNDENILVLHNRNFHEEEDHSYSSFAMGGNVGGPPGQNLAVPPPQNLSGPPAQNIAVPFLIAQDAVGSLVVLQNLPTPAQNVAVPPVQNVAGPLPQKLPTQRPYPCSVCPRRFARKDDREGHVDRVHLDKKKPHKCRLCGKSFARRDVLVGHLENVHRQFVPPAPKSKNDRNDRNDRNDKNDKHDKPYPNLLTC